MTTKYEQISSSLFIKNRKKFVEKMQPNSLAIFNSNDIYPISSDSTMPFAQHRDIFYLSGVDQEESILVVFPDCHKEQHREILFLKETNETIAVWEGHKYTKEEATAISGIKNIQWTSNFEAVLKVKAADVNSLKSKAGEINQSSFTLFVPAYPDIFAQLELLKPY